MIEELVKIKQKLVKAESWGKLRVANPDGRTAFDEMYYEIFSALEMTEILLAKILDSALNDRLK